MKRILSSVNEEYFLDEVRDGFYIPSLIKRLWAAVMMEYGELRRISKKLGLHDFAAWGTLLGVIRYGGFVPWDDDIDIEMKREDYEKLKEYMDSEEAMNPYRIDDYSKTNNTSMIGKWVRGDRGFYQPHEWKDRYGFPFEVVSDIFILDYIPKEEKDRSEFFSVISMLYEMMFQARELYRYRYGIDDGITDAPDVDPDALLTDDELYIKVKTIGDKLDYDFDIWELKRKEGDLESGIPLWIQICKCMDAYKMRIAEDGEKCNELTFIYLYFMNRSYINKKELYDDTVLMPFEGGWIPVPIGYDGILRKYYHNFMIPVQCRGGHDYPYFRDYEKQLREKYGVELLKFRLDVGLYKKVWEERLPKITLEEELSKIEKLFSEAHGYLINNLDSEEEREGVLDVLSQCQSLALEAGNQIEIRACDGEDRVHALEEYCEDLYRIYVGASEGRINDKQIIEEWDGKMSEILERVSEKKEVVFLPWRSTHWRSLHTLWEELSSDPTVDVTVIPVPYYLRNEQWLFDEKDVRIDMEGFPKEVEVTSFEDYSFEKHHPDVIIIQSPYDEFSGGYSVHPFFYSRNLKKFTEKMVLIPPFTLAEIQPGESQARYTLDYFVNTPGVYYSDMVIVQSENLKNVFIELLKKHMSDVGAEVEIDWESRIIPCGSPIYDIEARENLDRKKTGDDKKTLGVMFSGSVLWEYGMHMIEKIQTVMKIVLRHLDKIEVKWIVDPLAQEILENRARVTWEEYKGITKQLKESAQVEVVYLNERDFDDGGVSERIESASDLTEFKKRLAYELDAYYGDSDVLISYLRELKKPVLWETPTFTPNASEEYEYKKWVDGISIAVEGEWEPENFIKEIERYERIISEDQYGKRIREKII